jgi:hypothetical protein
VCPIHVILLPEVRSMGTTSLLAFPGESALL